MLFSEPKIPQRTCATLWRTGCHVSVLFSEPKIPQRTRRNPQRQRGCAFQCSSASRKFLNRSGGDGASPPAEFQCSSASRKFLNAAADPNPLSKNWVSVLFSEPKIPQRKCASTTAPLLRSFSALQRAENSSTCRVLHDMLIGRGFSALQRAENSSSIVIRIELLVLVVFQCSSASRKFLKRSDPSEGNETDGFSALQRAENSSIYAAFTARVCATPRFSALQRAENSSMLFPPAGGYGEEVSVLFSEPKIPQLR